MSGVAAAESATAGCAAEGSATADPAERAREVALRRLSHGPRTRAQLRSAMLERDVPEEVADTVLDRFVEVGLVDDAAFAEQWVRDRHAVRGVSRRGLAAELRRKGVPADVASEALEQVGTDDERAAARRLVDRRLPATRGLDERRRASRLLAMLARKGYDHELAGAVVRAALEADAAEEADEG